VLVRRLRRNRGGQSNRWLAGAGTRWSRLRKAPRLVVAPVAVALLAGCGVAIASAASGPGSGSGSGSGSSQPPNPALCAGHVGRAAARAPGDLEQERGPEGDGHRDPRRDPRVGQAGSPWGSADVLQPADSPYHPIVRPDGVCRASPFPVQFRGRLSVHGLWQDLPAQFPAPTLRLNIGDTLDLTTVDKLATPQATSSCRASRRR